jgi:hypothetical protein
VPDEPTVPVLPLPVPVVPDEPLVPVLPPDVTVVPDEPLVTVVPAPVFIEPDELLVPAPVVLLLPLPAPIAPEEPRPVPVAPLPLIEVEIVTFFEAANVINCLLFLEWSLTIICANALTSALLALVNAIRLTSSSFIPICAAIGIKA